MKLILFLFVIYAGQSTLAEDRPKRIVFLGDSITAGYGVTKNEAYPAILDKAFKSQKKSLEIVNVGISGSTSASLKGRLKWLLKKKIDILVIGIGGNDGLRGFPIETTKDNISQAIKTGKDQGAKVLLLGMELPENYGKDYIVKFKKIFPELAKSHSIELMPFLLKGVAGSTELNLADRIHPNAEGHKIIAKNMLPYLERLLANDKGTKSK